NKVEEPLKYVVTFDSQGGSVVEQQLIEEGSLVTKPNPDPTKPGYNFIYWYLSNEDIPYNFNFPVIQNITLTAKWEEISNSTTLASFDYSGYSNYYNSLNGLTSDSAIIIELADILRDTLTSYKGYSTSTEYNW